MDVQKFIVTVLLSSFLGACSSPKSKTDEITSSFDSAKCRTSHALETEFIVHWEDGRFSVETADNPESFREKFVRPREADIRSVQINQKVFQLGVRSHQSVSPKEFSFPGDQWGQQRIEAAQLWAQGFRGQGIKVGIIDSQVDVSHSQLRQRVAVNSGEIPGNNVDDDNNGVVDDYWGAEFFSPGARAGANEHGTHVAGIVAADGLNGPMTGVAPEAQIIPSAFLDNSGSGTLGDAILAMQYAISRGAHILNASWGGAGCSDSLAKAFSEFSQRGVLLVVAAGNYGVDIDYTPFYPAAFALPTQITVGASNYSDVMPTWSNNGFKLVQLTAPGESILSTGLHNSYLTMDGTSMAAPFVAGAAAALWSAHPSASATQIKQAILRGVDVVTGKQSKTLTQGRLNLVKSLAELRRVAQ